MPVSVCAVAENVTFDPRSSAERHELLTIRVSSFMPVIDEDLKRCYLLTQRIGDGHMFSTYRILTYFTGIIVNSSATPEKCFRTTL